MATQSAIVSEKVAPLIGATASPGALVPERVLPTAGAMWTVS